MWLRLQTFREVNFFPFATEAASKMFPICNEQFHTSKVAKYWKKTQVRANIAFERKKMNVANTK